MKKSIKLTLACMAAFALAACVTPTATIAPASGTGPATLPTLQQSPAQIAAQVCPPVQTALNGLNALVGLPAGAQADLKAITPIVDGVCAVGVTVNTTNLQQLAQDALPTIVSIVKASAMSAEQQNSVILDITAAQLILGAVNQAQANFTAPATPATAPAAAPSK